MDNILYWSFQLTLARQFGTKKKKRKLVGYWHYNTNVSDRTGRGTELLFHFERI